MERKSGVRLGRSHRSHTERGVGCEGQENRWEVVWGATPQEEQRGSVVLPILGAVFSEPKAPLFYWIKINPGKDYK